jgi:hypothetical protein
MSLFLAETLRRKQKAHDLRAEGITLNEIQSRLAPVGRTTIGEWLRRPRPTDEEVEAAKDAIAYSEQISFKGRFDPDLYQAIFDEATTQGASLNKLVNCAVRLYLDCQARARSGSTEPVNLQGYLK